MSKVDNSNTAKPNTSCIYTNLEPTTLRQFVVGVEEDQTGVALQLIDTEKGTIIL